MQIEEYKAAVGKFPTGVTLISTSCDGELLGFTANTFASVSLHPPIVSFCLNKEAGSLHGFKKSDHFAIGILAFDQELISTHFASHIKNKFNNIDYFIAESSNCPIVKGVVSFIECSKQSIIECGDHFIFTGQVLAVKVCNDKAPLVYFAKKYNCIK